MTCVLLTPASEVSLVAMERIHPFSRASLQGVVKLLRRATSLFAWAQEASRRKLRQEVLPDMLAEEAPARSGTVILDTPGAAEALNSISRKEHRFYRIHTAFQEHVDTRDNPVVQAVVWMLGYRFVDANDRPKRERYNTFKPDIEFQDRIFPPYLDDVGRRDDIRSIWGDLAGLVESPAVRARLHDLLWITERGPDRHSHAISAIENYLLAATPAPGTDPCVEQRLDSVSQLTRASELSGMIGAPELAARVCARAVEVVASELCQEDASSRPGAWMPLLDLLISLDEEQRPSDLPGYLARAHELLTHPNHRLALFQMEERLARGHQDEIDRIQQAEADMLISHALQQEGGLAKAHWLRQALELTRGRSWAGSTEQRIVGELQQIDPDSFDWQQITSQVEISAGDVERVVESIVGEDQIEATLKRFRYARWISGRNPRSERAGGRRGCPEARDHEPSEP